MTTQGVKAVLAKVIGIGVLAGAVAIVMPQRAEAQQFAVGVQVGGPVYGYGYGPRPDYYAHQRWEHEQHEREEAYARQQAWIAHERREAWERERFHGYDRDGDRGGYYGR